jgi:hypothetical protein
MNHNQVLIETLQPLKLQGLKALIASTFSSDLKVRPTNPYDSTDCF